MPADPILTKAQQIMLLKDVINEMMNRGRRMTAEEQQWCETLAAVASALKQEPMHG